MDFTFLLIQIDYFKRLLIDYTRDIVLYKLKRECMQKLMTYF